MWLHSVVRTVGAGVIFEVLVVLGVRPKQLQPEDSCAAPNLVRAAGVPPRSTRARFEGAVAGQTLDDTNRVSVAVVVKLELFNSCQHTEKLHRHAVVRWVDGDFWLTLLPAGE